ncbi:MAG TPA: outer membrane beta-barrel protein [Nitrospira sp.]|nr:outer membrane beta-barrel protein [Nitrospira sp.]
MWYCSHVSSRFCLVLFVLAIGLADARGEEPSGPVATKLEHAALRLKEAEQTVEKRRLSEHLRLQWYGYLEGSYTQNFNNPSNRINQLRIFDVNSNQFRPNLAQLVLEREAKTEGAGWDRVGFHVKFNAGRDSGFIGGTSISQWADFQEYYVQYIAPVGHGLNLQAGQINSLVGYEVVESPRNANYSRSWLFGLGQPFTTRGVRASYEFNKQVSLSVGAIAYINSARADTNFDPLVEYALALSPTDKVKLTLYGVAGPRDGPSGTTGGTMFLTGGFLSLHLSDRTSAVIESYYANQSHSSLISAGGNARWDGVAAYLIHDLTEQWGLRLRAEIFEDAGGFVACQGTTAYQPRANVCFGATSEVQSVPIAQTLWEVTGTVQYKPFASLMTRLEYRYDKSNQNVFQLGNRATSYQPTLSLDVIYLF